MLLLTFKHLSLALGELFERKLAQNVFIQFCPDPVLGTGATGSHRWVLPPEAVPVGHRHTGGAGACPETPTPTLFLTIDTLPPLCP